MDITSSQVESIVRKILGELDGGAKPTACGAIPKTAKVATLTAQKKIEVKEYPLPALQDDDILVKVEGCGVCGTDVHEWKVDPFGIIPVTLGHEGTGEIVYLGKNIKKDTAGNPIKVGDKLEITMGPRTIAVEVLVVADNVRKDDACAMYKEI